MKKNFVFIMLVVSLVFTAVEAFGQDFSARLAYTSGKAMYDEKDYEAAIRFLDKAIEGAPDYFDAYFIRAMSYMYLFNYDKAITDFNQALRIRPDQPTVKEALESARQKKANSTASASQPAAPPAPVYVSQNCTACNGTGKVTCSTCNGQGKIKVMDGYTIKGGFGVPDMHMPATYSPCWGCMSATKVNCSTCKGSGKVQVLQTSAAPAQPAPRPAQPTPAPSPQPVTPAPSATDFEINGTTLVKYRGKSTNVTIPEGVTAIWDKAFFYSNINGVTIPDIRKTARFT